MLGPDYTSESRCAANQRNATEAEFVGPMTRYPSLLPAALRAATALLGVGSSALRAQQEIRHWDGVGYADNFGASIAAGGDTNGDGVGDILIGAGAGDCNTVDDGSAYLFSGRDGVTLQVQCGSVDQFGLPVAFAGDIDGDGVVDLIVGAQKYDSPSAGHWAGRAVLYSGQSGALIQQYDGEFQNNGFGSAAAGLGDVDGDGVSDFVIGALAYNDNPPISIGRAYVYSGKSRALIRIHEGEKQHDVFGINAAAVGDVDGDGVPDYTVSALLPQVPDNSKGAVYVYSGASGGLLYKWEGASNAEGLGTGVTGQLDWNADGFGDVIVGAAAGTIGRGTVHIYSGKDGSELINVQGHKGEYFGGAVANVGDLNDDGYPEILVGAQYNDDLARESGRAVLLSGRTLRRLYVFHGLPKKQLYFGFAVAGGIDCNGDGMPDMLVGAFGGQSTDPKGGRVTLFAGNDLYLQATPNLVTAGDTLDLDTRGGAVGALTLLTLVAVNGAPTFTPIALTAFDANGEFQLSGTVPPGLSGYVLDFQSFAQKGPTAKGIIDTSRETLTIY